MLHIHQKLGCGDDIEIDIATDPLENTSACARGGEGAFSVIAIGNQGSIIQGAHLAYYMDRIVTHENYDVSFAYTAKQNVKNIAYGKGCNVSELKIAVMNRPRNQGLIDTLNALKVQVELIEGGCIDYALRACCPDFIDECYHVDAYMGIGGCTEGVISASALKSLGGQICGKFIFFQYDKKKGYPILMREKQQLAMTQYGIDSAKEYTTEDFVGGDTIFVASAITKTSFLSAPEKSQGCLEVNTLILSCIDDAKNFEIVKNIF